MSRKIKLKRRDVKSISKEKVKEDNLKTDTKESCNKHSSCKIKFEPDTHTCPLCETNKLVVSLTDIIDKQRKQLLQNQDVLYRKFLLTKNSF